MAPPNIARQAPLIVAWSADIPGRKLLSGRKGTKGRPFRGDTYNGL